MEKREYILDIDPYTINLHTKVHRKFKGRVVFSINSARKIGYLYTKEKKNKEKLYLNPDSAKNLLKMLRLRSKWKSKNYKTFERKIYETLFWPLILERFPK